MLTRLAGLGQDALSLLLRGGAPASGQDGQHTHEGSTLRGGVDYRSREAAPEVADADARDAAGVDQSHAAASDARACILAVRRALAWIPTHLPRLPSESMNDKARLHPCTQPPHPHHDDSNQNTKGKRRARRPARS